jgi:hypothetical protein
MGEPLEIHEVEVARRNGDHVSEEAHGRNRQAAPVGEVVVGFSAPATVSCRKGYVRTVL